MGLRNLGGLSHFRSRETEWRLLTQGENQGNFSGDSQQDVRRDMILDFGVSGKNGFLEVISFPLS